ncbi:glycosyl transferase family 1 [Neobacillus vireti]|nr:glycosyl transferase family 1 [Neobacillus vireti]
MNRGGLETMLMNYYRQIDRSMIQFDFMVHRPEEGHYDKEILKLGGRIYQMPQIRPGNYRLYFKLLDEFFRKHKEYRVVHSHINENSSFVLRAAKKAGIPCRIAHSHLSDLGIDLKLPFRLYARFFMKNKPNNYFACSKKAGLWLFGNKIASSNEIKVLNNAVNAEEFKYNETVRKRIRNDLGIKDELVIGHIGRFNKQKNHEFLLDIFRAVHQKCPDAILLLIGEGHLRSSIERKVEQLGLSSNVKFFGVRSDIPNLMQAMDLFLFPSLFEGLPVVLIEAQAAGLKCIVSDSITEESDITGRVEFISINKSPEYWTNKILSSSFEHKDTSEKLQKNDYDSAMMAKWLSNFYSDYYTLDAK